MTVTYSVNHVRNFEIKQLSPLCFAMPRDIWYLVYNEKLQFRFTFRSGPMILDQVVALGLSTWAKYLIVKLFVAMRGDIDWICGI